MYSNNFVIQQHTTIILLNYLKIQIINLIYYQCVEIITKFEFNNERISQI